MENDRDDDESEACPLCNRRNVPPESDVCAHWLGLWLDGRLEWSEHSFEDEWNDAVSAVEDLSKRAQRAVARRLTIESEKRAFKALRQHDPGWWVEDCGTLEHDPVGLFGDSGSSVYHRNPEAFAREIRASLVRIATLIDAPSEGAAPAPGQLGTPPIKAEPLARLTPEQMDELEEIAFGQTRSE